MISQPDEDRYIRIWGFLEQPPGELMTFLVGQHFKRASCLQDRKGDA